MLTIAGCGTDDPVATDVVGTADAITAIVAWEAGEQDPVLDDNGAPLLPVVFIVPDGGATIDVGVQADVAESTVDWAKVRFADETDETFESDEDGEPVRDDGALLLLGNIPEPAPSIVVEVVRYTTIDDPEPFTLEITVDRSTETTAEPALRASVTAVTQP